MVGILVLVDARTKPGGVCHAVIACHLSGRLEHELGPSLRINHVPIIAIGSRLTIRSDDNLFGRIGYRSRFVPRLIGDLDDPDADS